MRYLRNPDLRCAAIVLIFAGIVLVDLAKMNRTALDDTIGASGVPGAYAVVLLLLGGLLAVRSLMVQMAHKNVATRAPTLRPAFALLLIGVVFLAIVPWVGYLLGVFFALMSVLYLQWRGPQSTRAFLAMLCFSLIGAVFFVLVFNVLLGTSVPGGLFGVLDPFPT